jgi:uncharacterized protein YbaA (DUF1428 family)
METLSTSVGHCSGRASPAELERRPVAQYGDMCDAGPTQISLCSNRSLDGRGWSKRSLTRKQQALDLVALDRPQKSVERRCPEAYLKAIKLIFAIYRENGALSTMDAWGVDVPDGVTTDFKKAVMATGDETVVLSWMVWPDKTTAEAASMKLRSDPRMNPAEIPFDMRRMIFGGFEPLHETKA